MATGPLHAPLGFPALRWDIFCRVVDNFGDIGVCWRLSRDLATRGQAVRLWVDDASALAWMAPQGAGGVQVRAWADAETAGSPSTTSAALTPPAPAGQSDTPGDVVVEAFGCDLPAAWLERMASRPVPPRWINLEYLSAEPYVERSHGLCSPQSRGPGRGLAKHFFYPGFTPATGGLLRETGLLDALQSFDAPAWLAGQGVARRPGERLVSLFAYANDGLPALLDALAAQPTRLLVAPGPLAAPVGRWLQGRSAADGLSAHFLPHLDQPSYDRLLWSCDLNLVRGEDSFVRAQWAGRPFLWNIYPQDDGAHAAKLQAFLGRFLEGAPPVLAARVSELHMRWNGLAPAGPFPALPDAAAWRAHCAHWRDRLAAQDDLAAQLMRFIREPG